jgi:cytochrome b
MPAPEPEWSPFYVARLAWTVVACLVAGLYLADRWPPAHLAWGYALLVAGGYVAIALVQAWGRRPELDDPEPAEFVVRRRWDR